MTSRHEGSELQESVEEERDSTSRLEARYVQISTEQSFSGPVPTPWAFREYEEILPGAADRILRIAEGEAGSTWESRSRRSAQASTALENNHDRERLGMYLGGALGGGLLVVAVVLALEGATWPAVVAAVSQLAPTLTALIPQVRRHRGRRD